MFHIRYFSRKSSKTWLPSLLALSTASVIPIFIQFSCQVSPLSSLYNDLSPISNDMAFIQSLYAISFVLWASNLIEFYLYLLRVLCRIRADSLCWCSASLNSYWVWILSRQISLQSWLYFTFCYQDLIISALLCFYKVLSAVLRSEIVLDLVSTSFLVVARMSDESELVRCYSSSNWAVSFCTLDSNSLFLDFNSVCQLWSRLISSFKWEDCQQATSTILGADFTLTYSEIIQDVGDSMYSWSECLDTAFFYYLVGTDILYFLEGILVSCFCYSYCQKGSFCIYCDSRFDFFLGLGSPIMLSSMLFRETTFFQLLSLDRLKGFYAWPYYWPRRTSFWALLCLGGRDGLSNSFAVWDFLWGCS